MSLVYNSNKFQYAVSQSLPFGEVRRGSSFNAYNCMKAYSFNGERYGYYGYDASGERTYKYDMYSAGSWTNQTGGMDVSLQIDKMMLYPNGYLNMNQNGEYTKHYYADALRIASKIGNGKSGLDLCSEAMAIENAYPDYLTDRINEQYEQMKEELWELVPGSEYIVDITPIPYPNFCDIGPGGQESALFFYHPDHLGSTGMITDNSANITQGFLYTPFGEIISDYSPTFHDSPMPNYAFNAKELDEENGMYYYSARYYAPPTFISRDPMFEKYPSISPYTYCSNNPLKFVDPDGRRVFAYDRYSKQQMKSYFKEQFGSSRMFRFNINNELKINNRQYNKAMDRANPNQKILLQGMHDVIKNDKIARVRITENSENIVFEPFNTQGYVITPKFVFNLKGGGGTYPTPFGYIGVAINHTGSNSTSLATDATKTIGKDDYYGKKCECCIYA
jgi:RHS repeat-associated protein